MTVARRPGGEVNLLDRYPRAKRPLADNRSASDEYRRIARRFEREYFDGDRTTGYGGYRYDGRWVPIAERIRDHYGLSAGDRVLDVGCAKGFLLHDLRAAVPGLEVVGLDVSAYALEHVMPDLRGRVVRGTAEHLPFGDGSFDLVIAINVLHNLERDACVEGLREVERVSRGGRYVQVDSWLNEAQRRNLELWVLTARTYVAPDDWRALFRQAGYAGDYYWTLTE
jgi:SAM-dependent methyltransferase